MVLQVGFSITGKELTYHLDFTHHLVPELTALPHLNSQSPRSIPSELHSTTLLSILEITFRLIQALAMAPRQAVSHSLPQGESRFSLHIKQTSMDSHSQKSSLSSLDFSVSTQVTAPDEIPAKVLGESGVQVGASETPVGSVPHWPISQRMLKSSVHSPLMSRYKTC